MLGVYNSHTQSENILDLSLTIIVPCFFVSSFFWPSSYNYRLIILVLSQLGRAPVIIRGHVCFNPVCFISAEYWILTLDQECFILAYLSSAKHGDISMYFVYFRMFRNN